jgi:hypothetical protein
MDKYLENIDFPAETVWWLQTTGKKNLHQLHGLLEIPFLVR